MSDQVSEVSATYLVEAARDAVPVGYKQTEIGLIPEDWELSDIKNISAVPMQNGLFYEPKRKGSGAPLINVSDMYKVAPIDVENLELFDATASEVKSFRVLHGDLFFTRSSVVPSGIAFCNIFYSTQANVLFDSHLIRVRPNREIIEPRYLYLNCISKHARTALISEAKTATMTTIDQGAINRCPVLLPTKKEQTAIANALSDVDALISELEKLIAKKQAIKTATMQQLLTGRTRLPQFALHEDGTPKGYKQSELGEIPDDWDIEEFSNLASPSSSRVNPKLYGGGDFCIELEHINQGDGYLSGFTTTNANSSLKNIFEKDDVLFGKLRAYLKKYWLSNQSGVCSTEIWVLKAKIQKSLSNFIFYLVQTERFIEAASEAYGTHMPRADWKVISVLPIATPRKKEQSAIANILSDMDKEIQALEQRLGKTRQIKQGMMQELLTGKTRLVKPANSIVNQ